MSTHNICFGGEIRKIGEALLLSTHNINFHGEIRKNIYGYPYMLKYLGLIGYFACLQTRFTDIYDGLSGAFGTSMTKISVC